MKKIVFFLTLLLSVLLYAEPPLVKVAQEELDFSKRFVKLERHQQLKLYDYVKLVKARYILTKELVWVSGKIADAVSIQASMIGMQEK